jgi:hypothetical protein
MKKALILLFACYINLSDLVAQSFGVGVNTPDASSIMELRSTNKGVLLPRLSTGQRDAITGLGAAQEGLLIYNINTDLFNFWNGIAWVVVPAPITGSFTWYNEFSATGASNATGDMYRTGRVGIGLTSAENINSLLHVKSTLTDLYAATIENTNGYSALDVDVSGANTSARMAINIDNAHSGNFNKWGIYMAMRGSGSGSTSAIRNWFVSTSTYSGDLKGVENEIYTVGNGNHYGTYNGIDNDGTGTKYGTYNTITGNTTSTQYGTYNLVNGIGTGLRMGSYNLVDGAGTGAHYGVRTEMSGSGIGIKYGYHVNIPAGSGGVHYGVYSSVLKAGSWSGYFLGRVYVGTTSANGYNLPSIDGTANYVMQTDGSGQVSWANPTSFAAAEWTDNGTYLSPADGVNEDVNIGSLVANSGKVNITTNKDYGVYILNTQTGTAESFGIRNYFTTTASTGMKIGIQNQILTAASGHQFGVFNYLDNNSFSPKTGTNNVLAGTTGADMTGINNGIVVNGNGTHYGAFNVLSGTGTGIHYGNYNSLNGAGTGERIGSYYTIAGAGTGTHYGVRAELAGSGTGIKYGLHSFITSTTGGTHYGLYSEVLKAGSWAGYFLGNVSIGTTTANTYTFPASRGTNGYVMQTNGVGQLSWVNPASFNIPDADWFEVGSTNAPNAITDDIFTQGFVGIGNTNPIYTLDISQTTTTALRGINLAKTDNTTNFTYGAYITKINNGSGRSHAIYTDVSGAGTGQKYGIFNEINSPADGSQYAVRNWIRSGTTASVFGVYNNLDNAGTGEQYATYNALRSTASNQVRGVHNEFDTPVTANELTGVRNQIYNGTPGSLGFNGVYNDITNPNNGNYYGNRTEYTGAATGTGNKYGTYNLITSTAGGTHYGTYNNVSVASGWAGYFIGRNYISDRLSIGVSDNPNAGLNIQKNSTGTYAQIEVTETSLNDGARISFNHSTQTANNWILYGQVNDVSNSTNNLNVFNIYHPTSGNIVRVESDGGSGIVGIGNINPTTNTLEVSGTASKAVAGSWLANSDERLKKNVVSMDSEAILQKILSMRGVTYEWNDDKTGYNRPQGIQYGFIAQDLQKIWPTKVSEDADGYLQTAYSDYDAMFVEAFKAQQAKINALQQQNETLANQLNQQQQTIETLQTSVEKLLKVIDTAKE